MKRIVWCVAVMMLLVCVGAWALAEEGVRPPFVRGDARR